MQNVVRPAHGQKSIAASSAPAAPLIQAERSPAKRHHHHRRQAAAEEDEQWNCADLLDKTKAKKRQFHWEVSGSLWEMSGEYYEKLLTNAESVMYHSPQEPADSARAGDATRAILLDGHFLSVTNRFPTTMVLSSNFWRGRVYSLVRGDSYERGLLIVPGNREIDFPGEGFGRFLLPHPSLMSDVVRKFAKDAHRNLLEECSFVKDSGKYLVPADSPIMYIIERNEYIIRQSAPDFSVRKLPFADGKYLLHCEYVEEASEVFEKAIKTRMPHVDMTSLTLRLKRLGASWRDPVIPGATDPSVNKRLLEMHGSFSVLLELTYRLPNTP